MAIGFLRNTDTDPHWEAIRPFASALDKLLGHLGIYAAWFSSIVYLQ